MTGDSESGFNLQHEQLIIYAKEKESLTLIGEGKDFKNYSNSDNDSLGEWCCGDPSAKSGGDSTYFPIENPYTHKVDYPPKGRFWAFSKASLVEYIKKGKVKFKSNYQEGERGFIFKRYKIDTKSLNNPLNSLFGVENDYMNQSATIELKSLLGSSCFNYPKPVLFLKKLIKSCTSNSNVVLDFFSGSATTAHAVMQLNQEDGGNRRFIMVQLPELCPEKSEAYKAGYKNICEIGKERIRRAGAKLLEKNDKTSPNEEKIPLDVGFRVLKLDSSNLKVWNTESVPDNNIHLLEQRLYNMVKRFKPRRSQLDLVFEIMIKLGIEPTETITQLEFDGKKVYLIREDCQILICLDKNIKPETVEKMVDLAPAQIVFGQNCFEDISAMCNAKLILRNRKIDIKFI